MSEVTTTETVKTETEVIVEKPYTLRPIEADDLDYLAGIIDKIGIDKIADCFGKKEINRLVEGKEVNNDLIKGFKS